MPRGRPHAFELSLAEGARAQLEGNAASRSLPAGLVRRAKAILLSATGLANREVGAGVDLIAAMVGHWRRRYRDLGLAGLRCAERGAAAHA